MRMKMNDVKKGIRPLLVGLMLMAMGDCATHKADGTPDWASGAGTSQPPTDYSFIATSDMREFTSPKYPGPQYFDGVCAAIRHVGQGELMVVPGDFDPPAPLRATLDRFFGADYPCFYVAGNHEVETEEDMVWLRQWAAKGIPGQVRMGPKGAEATMYSFDHANSHFIAFNQYYDGIEDTQLEDRAGRAALNWLAADLEATDKPLIWVFGHEPIVSQPDMDTLRVRHKNDSLNAVPELRDEFVRLLNKHKVKGFICGHTHNASVVRVEGIWQLDAGHARGIGDKGAPSTFIKIRVAGQRAYADVYRANKKGRNYRLRKTVSLND